MKRMRLDDMAVQGKEASLVLPEQPAVVPTGSECGGNPQRRSEPTRPARQENRRLQDFLSAFV